MAGGALWLGRDLQRMDATDRAHFRGASIGFVFQAFNLLPALDVVENVAVPLLVKGVPRSAAVSRARELLGMVGLGGREKARPSQLSGGQQQRVAIARALVHRPKLVVCDEPTSNLDRDAGRLMIELLRNLVRGPDRALIVVTHDSRIFQFGDRIARMDDGKIVEIVGGGEAELSR